VRPRIHSSTWTHGRAPMEEMKKEQRHLPRSRDGRRLATSTGHRDDYRQRRKPLGSPQPPRASNQPARAHCRRPVEPAAPRQPGTRPCPRRRTASSSSCPPSSGAWSDSSRDEREPRCPGVPRARRRSVGNVCTAQQRHWRRRERAGTSQSHALGRASSSQVGSTKATAVAAAFGAQHAFLRSAGQIKKPALTSNEFANLLKPTSEALGAAIGVKEPGRERKFSNHLSAVSEGLPAIGWVTIVMLLPALLRWYGYSTRSAGAQTGTLCQGHEGQCRVLFQQGRQRVQGLGQTTRRMGTVLYRSFGGAPQICLCSPHDGCRVQPQGQPLVLENHNSPPLLILNYQGIDISEFLSRPTAAAGPVAPSAPAGGPAPPPPPPPPPVLSDFPSSSAPAAPKAPAAGDMGAVFSELNRGEAVTKGLRKVDKAEMTHKNPALRSSSAAGPAGTSRRLDLGGLFSNVRANSGVLFVF
jgi:hypothetical protein